MLPEERNEDALRLLMPLEIQGVFDGDVAVEGALLDAAQAQADKLLKEMHPDTCYATLDDWERELGLPEPCTGKLTIRAQRQQAAVLKHAATGGLSRQYFIDLAAHLGFVITIDEGIDADPFKWRVNAPAQPVTSFRAGINRAGTPLRWWNNIVLECAINRLKPAHTEVVFAYGA
jgi:uncharacterized protein YmfQ (DUF2313 family)